MTIYPQCIHCARPIRPPNTRIAEHPGTVPTHTHEVCAGCYRRIKRTGTAVGTYRNIDHLVEDVEWLTHPDNYVDSPENISDRLEYSHVDKLIRALRGAGRPDLAARLIRRQEVAA